MLLKPSWEGGMVEGFKVRMMLLALASSPFTTPLIAPSNSSGIVVSYGAQNTHPVANITLLPDTDSLDIHYRCDNHPSCQFSK